MTEEIKEQAVHLAKKGGYRTLVPDLYKGKLGADQEEAQHVSTPCLPATCVFTPWAIKHMLDIHNEALILLLCIHLHSYVRQPLRWLELCFVLCVQARCPLWWWAQRLVCVRELQLMEGLDWQLAVKELTQAVDYLLESGATKVLLHPPAEPAFA